jgi:hypothetical protein
MRNRLNFDKPLPLVLLVLLLVLSLPAFGQTPSIADDFEQQIQNLIGIEQALTSYNEQMETLRGQMLSLTDQLGVSEQQSSMLMEKLSLSQIALQAYQGKVGVLLSNYDGLLTLSKQYRDGLETWRTAFWISTGIGVAGIIVALLVK